MAFEKLHFGNTVFEKLVFGKMNIHEKQFWENKFWDGHSENLGKPIWGDSIQDFGWFFFLFLLLLVFNFFSFQKISSPST